jgi:hypothetical protein
MGEAINHPAHYQGKIECIEAIMASIRENPCFPPVISSVFFKVLKYHWWQDSSSSDCDTAKAIFYRNWLFKYFSDRYLSNEVDVLMSEFDSLIAKALELKNRDG